MNNIPHHTDANAKQVGGDHYRSTYQHWDWVTEIGMPYILGCATKYLVRWRKKNGLQDLEKALHYVEKAKELNVGIQGDKIKLRMTELFIATNMQGQEQETNILLQILIGNYPNAIEQLNALIAGEIAKREAEAKREALAKEPPKEAPDAEKAIDHSQESCEEKPRKSRH